MRKFDKHWPLWRAGYDSPLAHRLRMSLVLAFVLIGRAAAQLPNPGVPSDPVLGFETTTGWAAQSSGMVLPRTALTATRTQGKFALSLPDTATVVTLISQSVSLSTPALSGIGSATSAFEVALLLPVLPGSPVDHGSLELSVSSLARHLSNASVGQFDLSKLRTGTYNTLSFPVPANIRTALDNSPSASPGDVSFRFTLHEPGNNALYLFDNLRVYAVTAVTGGPGVHPQIIE